MLTWPEIVRNNPQHSANYAARWDNFRAAGRDIDGEARLIDAMAPRHSRIADIGCGTGRVGGVLATRGHTVAGIDIDPYLIDRAQTDFPDSTWTVGDITRGDKPDGLFDVVVCAGNVMWFIAPEGRRPALTTIKDCLQPDGIAVVAFGAGRGYFFGDFFKDLDAVGLAVRHKFGSWDLHAFNALSDYLVAVLELPKENPMNALIGIHNAENN